MGGVYSNSLCLIWMAAQHDLITAEVHPKETRSIPEKQLITGYDKSETVLTICKLVCTLSDIFKKKSLPV